MAYTVDVFALQPHMASIGKVDKGLRDEES